MEEQDLEPVDSEDLVEGNSNVELPLEVQEPLDINTTDPENPDESVSAEFTEILSDIKERKIRKKRRNKDQA